MFYLDIFDIRMLQCKIKVVFNMWFHSATHVLFNNTLLHNCIYFNKFPLSHQNYSSQWAFDWCSVVREYSFELKTAQKAMIK